MRIDVYQGQELAATFEYRRAPVYHGAAGEELRVLLQETYARRNPGTGDLFARRKGDIAATWAARLLAAVLA
ncbi:MAG TPA: hypothetical protein VFL91_22055, partial [Thermomicrobiales bacterium]|nr:hypothetical protein [Thermomicrobiales bacterium]